MARRCGSFRSREAKRKYEAYKHMHGLAKAPRRKKKK
jgi:hypothetical protein